MKYLLIMTAFFISSAFAESNSAANAENCSYATQDIHTVSNSAYNRLLAQLESDDKDKKTKKSRKRGRGQR